jgi:transcriptional regulator with XRE-family HTH domain
MNTKLSNKELQKIQDEFDKVFTFENEQDQIEVDAHSIMAMFLSEAQEIADKNGIKRKELAKKIGTSASYLTQLFRGHKLINLITIAKLQKALDIKFKISIEGKDKFSQPIDEESIAEHLDKWFTNRKSGEYFKVVRNLTIPSPDENGYSYSPNSHQTKKFA